MMRRLPLVWLAFAAFQTLICVAKSLDSNWSGAWTAFCFAALDVYIATLLREQYLLREARRHPYGY